MNFCLKISKSTIVKFLTLISLLTILSSCAKNTEFFTVETLAGDDPRYLYGLFSPRVGCAEVEYNILNFSSGKYYLYSKNGHSLTAHSFRLSPIISKEIIDSVKGCSGLHKFAKNQEVNVRDEVSVIKEGVFRVSRSDNEKLYPERTTLLIFNKDNFIIVEGLKDVNSKSSKEIIKNLMKAK